MTSVTADYNLEYWESKSLDLLREATSPLGIKASCTNTTNYGAVFTRDAVMSGIAGLLYNDEKIITGLRATIDMLNKLKGTHGQIASNYKITDNQIGDVSFGTLSPKIDAATWYLVGIGLLMNRGFTYELDYIESTISLLEALEYNDKDLIYIPQGGNWADEYPFEGYILYDQLLRAWALKLLGKHFGKIAWSLKAEKILETISAKYYNYKKGYFNCSFLPSGDNDTFDFAAHNLMGMLEENLISDAYEQSLSWINEHFISKSKLPVAFYPVIGQKHKDWDLISTFHLFDFKNKPHHYHNGGIWFIWLGWFALALHKHKKHKALDLLGKLSFDRLNAIDHFDFDEYLSGDSLVPNGTKKLCYTATGILFLCKTLKEKGKSIDLFYR